MSGPKAVPPIGASRKGRQAARAAAKEAARKRVLEELDQEIEEEVARELEAIEARAEKRRRLEAFAVAAASRKRYQEQLARDFAAREAAIGGETPRRFRSSGGSTEEGPRAVGARL